MVIGADRSSSSNYNFNSKHRAEDERRRWWNVIVAMGLVLTVLGGVFAWSTYAGLVVVTDGVLATLIVGAAVSAGTWATKCFGLNDDVPLRWQVLVGAVAGIWGLATLMLVLGTLGVMSRGVWSGILGGMAVLGIVRVHTLVRIYRRKEGAKEETSAGSRVSWLWLWATPFLLFALLVATTPPGLLWAEEAGGYDVLEYHLGCPKEFLDAGRIGFLRHNVYANFPFNAEMLSLVSMILSGGAYKGIFVAKLVNLWLAMLTVFAAWVAGREFGKSAGTVAGVLAATTPWLTYLSGVAYVENGLLFMGMASVAMLCRYGRCGDDSRGRCKWAVLAGAAAGGAAGFKYTGFAMVAGPVLVGLGLLIARSKRKNWSHLVWFAAASLATSSPWLIKNVAYTGNPVFPLATSVFPVKEGVWTEALAQRWEQGHQPAEGESSIGRRVRRFGERVLIDAPYGRMGPVLFLLAAGILFTRQRAPIDGAMVVVLVMQAGVWIFATHLYARFAVPLMIPLVVLAGRLVVAGGGRLTMGLACAGVCLSAAVNLGSVWRLFEDHFYVAGRRVDLHLPPSYFLNGQVPGYEFVGGINGDLPPSARVLLVAEARHFYIDRPCDYAVVFSPSKFHEAVAREGSPAAILAWLRAQGITHVYVSWSEMSRFAQTYSWDEWVDVGLFERLQRAGLRPIRGFALNGDGRPYGQLYEVVGQ